jgi:hypothetical protein
VVAEIQCTCGLIAHALEAANGRGKGIEEGLWELYIFTCRSMRVHLAQRGGSCGNGCKESAGPRMRLKICYSRWTKQSAMLSNTLIPHLVPAAATVIVE